MSTGGDDGFSLDLGEARVVLRFLFGVAAAICAVLSSTCTAGTVLDVPLLGVGLRIALAKATYGAVPLVWGARKEALGTRGRRKVAIKEGLGPTNLALMRLVEAETLRS